MRLYQDEISNIYGAGKAKTQTKRPFALEVSNAKSKEEHGEHTWIYSFADLIMNLLMFFMLLFAISSIDQDKLKAVKEAISTHIKSDPAAAEEKKEGIAKQAQVNNRVILENAQKLLQTVDKKQLEREKQDHVTFTQLQAELKDLKKIVGLGVAVDPERDVFDVIFSSRRLYDKRGIVSPEGRTLIKRLAGELEKSTTRLVINIQAHTSPKDAKGKIIAPGDAFRLTSKQTNEVLSLLRESGLSNKHVISLAAYGTLMPLLDKASDVNERIIVRVGRAVPKADPKMFVEEVR